MKKFENGDDIEVWDGVNATYIGISKNVHVFLSNGRIDNCQDEYIRPVKLICDEARAIIEKALNDDLNISFKFNSDEIFNEYLSFLMGETLPSSGWKIIARKSGVCIVNGFEHYICDDYKDYPELNLKTGEVIPCEGITDNELANIESILNENKNLKELCKAHVKELKERSNMYQNQVQEFADFKKITGSNLKEKDNELEDAEVQIEILVKELKEKDAYIERLNEQNIFMSEKVALYDDAMHSLNADIDKIENM